MPAARFFLGSMRAGMVAALTSAGLPSGAGAAGGDWQPDAVHVEVGRSARDSAIAGLGVRWDWDWQRAQWGGCFSGGTEVSIASWSARLTQLRKPQLHLSLTPLLRWRPSEGASRWFVEGGIGLSYHPRPDEAEDVPLSTHWNFHDVLAVGYSIGAHSDMSLRAVHISNAGIRKPNPGANVLMLHWARRF